MIRDFSLAVMAVAIFNSCIALYHIDNHLAQIAEQMSKPLELKQPIVVQPLKVDLTQPESMVNNALLPPPKEKSDKGNKKH